MDCSTTVVCIRFDNDFAPPRRTPERCMRNFDVRQVFGSAGMLCMGDIRRSHRPPYSPDAPPPQIRHLTRACTAAPALAELATSLNVLRTGARPSISPGEDAAALSVALAYPVGHHRCLVRDR